MTERLKINKSLTLKGSGAVTLDGNNTCQVIFINGQTNNYLTVNIEGFTIKNGKTADVDGAGKSAKGAGIEATWCSLTVTNCRFENNKAGKNGGGICIFSSGSSVIQNCTFINNKANNNSNYEGGSAIYVDGSHPLDKLNFTITNCTFTGNTSENSNSGALCVGATSSSAADVTVNYCTFATDSDKIYVNGSNGLTVKNSIIRATPKRDSEFNENITTDNNITITDSLTSENVTVTSGDTKITHTVYRKESELSEAIDNGNDSNVKIDQLGDTVTNKHDIGAVEIAIAHEHSFTYSASGAVLTATCIGAGTCDLTNKQATITLVAPSNLVYDGNAKIATISGSIPGVENPSITYASGAPASPSSPVNAGTYTASITLGNATASVSFTITEKTADVAVTLTPATSNMNVTQGETNTAWFKAKLTYSNGQQRLHGGS